MEISVEDFVEILDRHHLARQLLQDMREAIERSRAQLCGDYPAPCNCDDPVTHDGANPGMIAIQDWDAADRNQT